MLTSTGTRVATALVFVAAVGVVLSQLLTLLPVWPLTLIEHFRVQMLVGGLLIAAGALALRPRYFDAVLLATLLHLVWLLPDLVRSPRPVPAGRPVRVLLLNVLSSNARFDDVRRLIADTNPDIIALSEIRQNWLDELAPALSAYPHRNEHPRIDNFGLALYARDALGPLTGGVEYAGAFPSIVATVGADPTTAFGIVLTHPMPPMTGEYQRLLDEQLVAVGVRARALAPRSIILGDFNSTPWSRPFRRITEASGFCDSRAGFGLQTSWVPEISRIMQIPIDHALVSCNIGVRDHRIERDVGSDHRPVIIDLVLP
jgi:endonuclease/exonuclease/phosphatase (EEP) superfamily protein YafD